MPDWGNRTTDGSVQPLKPPGPAGCTARRSRRDSELFASLYISLCAGRIVDARAPWHCRTPSTRVPCVVSRVLPRTSSPRTYRNYPYDALLSPLLVSRFSLPFFISFISPRARCFFRRFKNFPRASVPSGTSRRRFYLASSQMSRPGSPQFVSCESCLLCKFCSET